MGSYKIYLCKPVVGVLVRVYHAFTYHFGILLGGEILETMDYPKGKFANSANTMALNNPEITWLTLLIFFSASHMYAARTYFLY